MVAIKVITFHEKIVSFPKSILEELFIATKKVWEDKKGSIRPLTGLNCKAGSFDAMEGKLDQDKKNEDLRVEIQNVLDGDSEYQKAKIRIREQLKELGIIR